MIAVLKTEPIEGLTQSERDRLQHLETIIQTGLQTFIEVGNALIEIRESKLYREDGTFEQYCKIRWGLSKPRAYQLIEAAEVVTELQKSTIVDLPLPNNEAQCRELAKVEPEARSQVWQETLERTDGKPTARDIREVAGLPSQRYDQGNEDTDPAEEWEDTETRYYNTIPLFNRHDLTEPEERLRAKFSKADDNICPAWDELIPLFEMVGQVIEGEAAQKLGLVPKGRKPNYIVHRPDLGAPFPLSLWKREQAWQYWQHRRDKLIGLIERKPLSDEFADGLKTDVETLSISNSVEPVGVQKSERVENDYYPTPEAITRPLLQLGCIKGQVFEPCAGSGDIAKLFDGSISNEKFPRPEFEPDLIGDASDPELWAELERMGGTDWSISNPPYGMELPTKILKLAAQHSREGVAMLLRLGFLEPCEERKELLKQLADNLRYVIPVNPRPQFRKDTTGTDSITVAWFVWDFTWSWEGQGIDCPFKFITDWKEAA